MVTKPTRFSERQLSPQGMMPSPRVLIVDDNPIHASALKRALREPSSVFGRMKCEIDAVEDVVSAQKYLDEDSIDIYFLDLEISERAGEGLLDASVGRDFVGNVVQSTNAGVIVCSNLSARVEAADLLEIGADDYIEKARSGEPGDPRTVAGRTLSVWRRVFQSRPDSLRAKLAHAGRVFLLGGWRFVVGNRTITNQKGKIVRVSPTEHAFLRYLCAVDGHAITSEIFNIDVLDRDRYEVHVRLDNFVHRLRKKFGGDLGLISQGEGTYKLLGVEELRPAT
jgi:DNA-binding response OmpR family regulator